MKPTEELLADAFPGERVVDEHDVSFEVRGVGRLGEVPVSGGRLDSLNPVRLIETQRFVLLDQRPGVARHIRRTVRVAVPVAAVSALTWLLPVSGVVHFVLLLPAFVAGMVLSLVIGAVQTNSGTTGLSNVIVIDKSLADADLVEPDGTRVVSGETLRDHLFAASLSLHLDEAGKLPTGILGSGDPMVSTPLFRFLRRRAPGSVRRTYRIRRADGRARAKTAPGPAR